MMLLSVFWMQQRGKGVIIKTQEELKLFRMNMYCLQGEVLEFTV